MRRMPQSNARWIFLHTPPFRAQDRQYSRPTTAPLRRAKCDTALIVGAAISGLRQIYRALTRSVAGERKARLPRDGGPRTAVAEGAEAATV